jgi:hypothetical protein
MKIIYSLILVLVFGLKTFGQSNLKPIIPSVIDLTEKLQKKKLNISEFRTIMGAYISTPDMDSILDNNPFFHYRESIKNKLIINEKIDSNLLENVVIYSNDANNQKIISSQWQNSILDGLAKFIAKRFQAEIGAYLMRNTFNEIKNDTIVKALFPDTRSYLGIIDQNIYLSDINIIKLKIGRDLKEMPINLLGYATSQSNDSIQNSIFHFAKLTLQFNQQKNESNFFQYLEQNADEDDNLKNISSILNILNKSLINESNVLYTNIDFVLNDKMMSSIYLGILYELLKEHGIDLQQFKSIEQLNAILRSYKILNNVLKEDNTNAIQLVQSTFDLLYNVSDLIDLDFKTYLEKFKNHQLRYVLNIINASYQNDYEKIGAELLTFLSENYFKTNTIQFQKALKIVDFLRGMLQVQSGDEFQQLLDTYALPLGSYSLKRTSKFNIALNSYAGITGGIENAYISNTETKTQNNIGLSAPVGISISGLISPKTFFQSFSCYIGLLDIGNIVNYRINEPENNISNFNFAQFFNIGGGIFLNIKNSPFTIGASYFYITKIRDITTAIPSAIVSKNANISRFNICLLVDIPLFNFK